MITNTPPTKQDPFLALKEACEDNPRLRPVSAVICDAAEDLAFRAGVITLFNELKMREQEVEELTNELQRMQKLNSELHNLNEQLQRAKTLISASREPPTNPDSSLSRTCLTTPQETPRRSISTLNEKDIDGRPENINNRETDP
jgi:TolA-binding protein